MNTPMKTIFSWCLGCGGLMIAILGAMGAAQMLAVIYMLMTNQIQPGQAYFVDGLAGSMKDSLVGLLYAVSIIVLGSFIIRFARRLRLN